jgi:heat shock protein HtpX
LKLTTAPRAEASGSTGENWTKSSSVLCRRGVQRWNDVQRKCLLVTMANPTELMTNTVMKDTDNTNSTGKKAFSAIYSINMNTIKIIIMLAALSGVFMVVGAFLGGRIGLVIALIFSAVMNFGSYWYSDSIVLKMYNAKPVAEEKAPMLYKTVRDLADKANMPMPKVYIIPDKSPNAFATGRNESHAAVAFTSGILDILNKDELEGVIGHELSHIKHNDILIGTMAATIASAVVVVSSMAKWAAIMGGGGEDTGGTIKLIATAIIAPVAATLIQMAISRSREYYADEGAAKATGKPEALASSLEKLTRVSKKIPLDANPATAHMFIVNPLSGNMIMNLFSTHPPLEKRIERLRKMKSVGSF